MSVYFEIGVVELNVEIMCIVCRDIVEDIWMMFRAHLKEG